MTIETTPRSDMELFWDGVLENDQELEELNSVAQQNLDAEVEMLQALDLDDEIGLTKKQSESKKNTS